jgi:hypothetical protein
MAFHLAGAIAGLAGWAIGYVTAWVTFRSRR